MEKVECRSGTQFRLDPVRRAVEALAHLGSVAPDRATYLALHPGHFGAFDECGDGEAAESVKARTAECRSALDDLHYTVQHRIADYLSGKVPSWPEDERLMLQAERWMRTERPAIVQELESATAEWRDAISSEEFEGRSREAALRVLVADGRLGDAERHYQAEAGMALIEMIEADLAIRPDGLGMDCRQGDGSD